MPIEPTEPLTPPVPPVLLSALLAQEELGLRQLAGPPARSVQLYAAHPTEMADPYPYLLGGELLLTAGLHITEAVGDPDAYFERYVSRLAQAGGAALGFGLAPVHDTVPAALVAACERHGMPLVEVPPSTRFSAVVRALWSLMAAVRHLELRRVTEAQQGLATAAARPDSTSAVLRQLAQRTGGFAVLVGPEGTELHRAGTAPSDAVGAALGALVRVVRPATTRLFPTPSSASDEVDGVQLSAYALGGPGGRALGLATAGRAPGDHTITGVAVVLLSLLQGEHQSAGDARRSAALVRLLLGERPEDTAGLLGPDDTWRVVHAQPLGAQPAPSLGTPLVDATDTLVRALVPAGQEITAHDGWALGVSAPAAPGELRTADTQAAHALSRARTLRLPLARHRADTPAPALAALADRPELRHTLRTWLSLHGSWDRTAGALGVHRNTVRQRIAKCATLVGADLDDPDVRMELWFGLRDLG
ncbi:PucR family transcriptional regulator [Streptomyces sp. VRA16 Mangrove soil]|uniref:PucR family transcriptional regulator n=1 Tax=Streptomyces sp. VRA16 Mangrove soil TaxID=2817434 RepID=UPI001A9EBFD6|nr:PucR family transcriptional regulator [Streptomyces sp. VRA16 Mangrove soil]MBO1334189.1 PucR family transcriptional regulator [Streptomyces sp. VRA16 Mangrove soil]